MNRPPPSTRRQWMQLLAGGLALSSPWQGAQAGRMLGLDAAGRAFDVDRLRGRLVLVFHWSTRCSVCMDKWPELRANARGWLDRPFTLVAVNVDDSAVWLDYERAVATVRPHGANVVSLHGGDRSARLPASEVIDPQGRRVQRVEGRLPAELWDDLAALLP